MTASVGNAFEWYDVIIYNTFALVIAEHFFPHVNSNSSLLVVFGTFGVSFLFRPLGGVIIGAYADRGGRKAALMLTMLLMLFGTLVIAATPSYAAIGIAAPILVVLGRLTQGFSAGGEFASATAFLAEQSAEFRGFYSSWQFASQGLAMAMAAGIGIAISTFLTADQIQHWGWRLPFVVGLLIGPALLYARSDLQETADFRRAAPNDRPLAEALSYQKAKIAIATGAVAAATVSIYVVLYLPTYAIRQLGLAPGDGFRATLGAGLVLFVLAPLSGVVSDRFGRLAVAIPSVGLLLIGAFPLFVWLADVRSSHALYAVELAIAVPLACYVGPLPAFLSDLFLVRSRSTGISLGYNLSVLAFGGFAPFLMSWIIAVTASILVPGWYLMAGASVSLITLVIAWFIGMRS